MPTEERVLLIRSDIKMPYPLISMGMAFVAIVFFYFLFNAKILHFLPTYLNDQISYIQAARHLIDYGRFSYPPFFPATGTLVYPGLLSVDNAHLYMPGFFILLAVSYKLFGVSPFTSILPNIVCYLLSSGLIFYLAKKLYSSSVAILATVFFIFFPFNILYSLTAMSEMPLVFLSLSIMSLIVVTPQKFKLFILPMVLLAYLFRQTEIFLLIPIIAYLFDQKVKAQSIIWVTIITLTFKEIIDYWQKKNGLHTPLLEILTYGHINYYDAFAQLPSTFWEITKQFLVHFYKNIYLLIKTILNFRLDNKIPAVSSLQVIFLSPFFLMTAIDSFIQKKLWRPLSCLLLFTSIATICILLYSGHCNTLLRMTLFTTPFIFMEAAKGLLTIKFKIRKSVIILYILATFIVCTFAAIQIRNQEKISNDRLSFIESIHPDQNLLLVAPEYLFIEYNYKHYPQLTAFVPVNRQTLFLLNEKYSIGTLIIREDYLGKNFTIDDLAAIHLNLADKKIYKNEYFYIFKRT